MNKNWDKARKSIEKRFNSKLVFNEKYLKTKIKSFEDKIITNFYDNGIPKDGFHCVCLSVLLVDSV